jgi:hypothetical protein
LERTCNGHAITPTTDKRSKREEFALGSTKPDILSRTQHHSAIWEEDFGIGIVGESKRKRPPVLRRVAEMLSVPFYRLKFNAEAELDLPL